MAKVVPPMTPEQVRHAVQVAWDDRPPYREVLMRCGLSPGQVVQLLKRELTPSAFRIWRARGAAPPGKAQPAGPRRGSKR